LEFIHPVRLSSAFLQKHSKHHQFKSTLLQQSPTRSFSHTLRNVSQEKLLCTWCTGHLY
jgi:hypothetical protein